MVSIYRVSISRSRTVYPVPEPKCEQDRPGCTVFPIKERSAFASSGIRRGHNHLFPLHSSGFLSLTCWWSYPFLFTATLCYFRNGISLSIHRSKETWSTTKSKYTIDATRGFSGRWPKIDIRIVGKVDTVGMFLNYFRMRQCAANPVRGCPRKSVRRGFCSARLLAHCDTHASRMFLFMDLHKIAKSLVHRT
jgi:hypothetical protein